MQVTKDEHIQEIYKAKHEIIRLSAQWMQAIRLNQMERAARIAQKTNRIKHEIRTKYDIIL